VKWFFDSSVLVAAFVEPHVHHEPSLAAVSIATPNTAACAAHSLAEVYSTLTRIPGRERLSGEHAALILDEIEQRFTLVELDSREYLATIRRAASLGVVGGAVYDALVAACALKAKAQHIYTWNIRHFNLLGVEVQKRITTPPAI
jgi:predicted nucleic acid-binding protein